MGILWVVPTICIPHFDTKNSFYEPCSHLSLEFFITFLVVKILKFKWVFVKIIKLTGIISIN